MVTAYCERCDELVSIVRLEIARFAPGAALQGAVRDADLACGHYAQVVVSHKLARESRSWERHMEKVTTVRMAREVEPDDGEREERTDDKSIDEQVQPDEEAPDRRTEPETAED